MSNQGQGSVVASYIQIQPAKREQPDFSYQHTEEVEVLGRPGVVTALVLELGVPVEGVQVLLSELGEKKEKKRVQHKMGVASFFFKIISEQ